MVFTINGATVTNYTIRQARPAEFARIPQIELAAAELFQSTRYVFVVNDSVNADEEYCRQQAARGLAWVAADEEDEAVGFVVAEVLDNTLFIHELGVLPAHGRHGLGRRLVDAVCQQARVAGYPAVTLSTFGDIPWNAPFYSLWGFVILTDEQLSEGLRAVQRAEAEGLPNTYRVIMRLELNRRGVDHENQSDRGL